LENKRDVWVKLMSGILIASDAASVEFFPDTMVYVDFNLSPNDSTCQVKFLSSGVIYDQDGATGDSWIFPNGAADGNWYIRANSASPDTPESGTMDTWLQLNSTRTWSVSELGIGSDSRTFTVDLKYGASGATVATGTVTITAWVDV